MNQRLVKLIAGLTTLCLLGGAWYVGVAAKRSSSSISQPRAVTNAAPSKPVTLPPKNLIVVLDPGHGGTGKVGGSSANNATGPAGLLEKDATLRVAFQARDELVKRGYQVFLTRDANVNLGLKDRAAVARRHRAQAFVSIHFNGNTNQAVQGTEVWVHPNCSDGSKRLGAQVQQCLIGVTG